MRKDPAYCLNDLKLDCSNVCASVFLCCRKMNFFPKYLSLNYGSLRMGEGGEAAWRETPVGMGPVFL